jgi:predicted component of type VI protein secretion system
MSGARGDYLLVEPKKGVTMTRLSVRRSAVAASVVLTLGLAACGSSKKSDTPSTDSTVKTAVTTAAGGAETTKAP